MDDEEFFIRYRIAMCQAHSLGKWENAPNCFSDPNCPARKRCLEEAQKVAKFADFLTGDDPKKAVNQ